MNKILSFFTNKGDQFVKALRSAPRLLTSARRLKVGLVWTKFSSHNCFPQDFKYVLKPEYIVQIRRHSKPQYDVL